MNGIEIVETSIYLVCGLIAVYPLWWSIRNSYPSMQGETK